MTDYEYLIHLLYCAVNDTQPQEKPESVSFQNVLSIAALHEVVPMAYCSIERLQNKPEEETYRQWQLQYYFAVQRDVRQAAERDAVVAMLHAQGIRTLEAQGTVTKRLYPSPELRMMSDIDFIVDADNMAAVKELLQAAGYAVKHDFTEEVETESPDGLNVEFHTDFFKQTMYDRKERFADALNNAFAHAMPDENDGLTYWLDDTYFYLFSLLHIIKHYETAGCGIRRIMDLYYLNKAFEGKIDTAVTEKVIAQYRFGESRDALMALEAFWLEGAAPERDLADVILKVLGSGNHGNKTVYTQNSIQKDRQEGVRLPVFKRVLRVIFPTKKHVYLNYPVCRERGYSLLRSRLYYWIHKLKDGRLRAGAAYLKRIIHSSRK